MPVLAVILLLVSAGLHATWNLLLKQAPDKYLAMGWQVLLSGGLSLTVLFFTSLPPRSMWPYALFSGVLEAVYFGVLTFAYNDHDFSLVYPVARGAAPALVVVWSALFLREFPSTGGLFGILLVVIGLAVIGATSLFQNSGGSRENRDRRPQLRGIAVALTVALIISVYTLVDGFAVKHGPTLPYGLSMFTLVPFLITPLIVRHYGWKPMRAALRAQPFRLALVGVLGVVAYLMALFAYSIAPVNYSEAIREVSVVMGAFAGWYFLGEKMGKIRMIGASVLFAGIVLIAVLG